MLTLKEKHPSVYQKFESGAFVVNKTEHAFSSIALDYARLREMEEQLN